MKPGSRSRSKPLHPPGARPLHRHTVRFEFSDPGARKVCLAGTFNSWRPETGQMERKDDGGWFIDVQLAPGTYEYRLVVDGNWRPDPNASHAIVNPFGERNSLVTVE